MNDEYMFLFAQWGVLTTEQCRFLFGYFGSFKAAWQGISHSIMESMGMSSDKIIRVLEIKNRVSFSDLAKVMKQFDVKIYYVDDPTYPEMLRNIPIPPPFIFVRGHLPSFHKAMAIVGTRAATPYGKSITQKFTTDLVRNGFVIVSGLALGIDSIAHQAVVENNGITVAVLGSGVDIVTPSSNHRLAQQILHSGGAIVSTYPLGTRAMQHHFPERNVIISGLSQGTLVTEGGITSGALITARQAQEQGRDVFAIPTSIAHYALSGTNHLIRTSQAKLVETIDHILEDMHLENKPAIPQFDFTEDEKILLTRLSAGGKNMDELMMETAFNLQVLSELMLQLQLKNAVAQQGSRWVLT